MEQERKIRALAIGVRDGKIDYGLLSTGERMAVDLVLNRVGYIKAHGTILDVVDRVGPVWLAACINVQREGVF